MNTLNHLSSIKILFKNILSIKVQYVLSLIILVVMSREVILYKGKGVGEFYQKYHLRTIEEFCGANLTKSKVARAFIYKKQGEFSCEELIRDHMKVARRGDPSTPSSNSRWYYQHYYASQFMKIAWHVFGTSWKSIYKLSKLFSIAYLLLSFILLVSIVKSPLIATALTLVCYSSSQFVNQIYNYRDLSKAPFALILFYVLYKYYETGFKKKWQEPLIVFLIGCILGISMGVRMDLKLLIPLMVCLIVTKNMLRFSLPAMALSLVLAFAGFYITNYPQYSNLEVSSASNAGHVINLGFSSRFDELMYKYDYGFTPAAHHADGYVFDLIHNNALMNGEKDIELFATEMGNDYNIKYYINILKNFPSYIVHRARQTFPVALSLFGGATAVKVSSILCIVLTLLLVGLPYKNWFLVTYSLIFVIFPMSLQFSARHIFYTLPLTFFLAIYIFKSRTNLRTSFTVQNLPKIFASLLILFLPLLLNVFVDRHSKENFVTSAKANAAKIALDQTEVKDGVLSIYNRFPHSEITDELMVLVSFEKCERKEIGVKFAIPEILDYRPISTLNTEHYVIHHSRYYPIHSIETPVANRDCIELYTFRPQKDGLLNLRLTGSI